MLKKVLSILLTGTFVLSLLVLVHQVRQASSFTDGEAKTAIRLRGVERQKDAHLQTEGSAPSPRGSKAAVIDTLLYFTAENTYGQPSWNDRVTGTAWDTVDHTGGKGREILLSGNDEPETSLTTSGLFSASGNWWWLMAQGHNGIYSAMNSDPFSGHYARNMENALVSPKIAHADLNGNLVDLWLMYYLRGRVIDPDTLIDNSDYISNEYKLDEGEWRGISTLHGPDWDVFNDFDIYSWWGMDQWPDRMRDLSPVLDSTWDTLQVAIRFHSDDDDTTGSQGPQVDDITLTGLIIEVPSPYAIKAGANVVITWPSPAGGKGIVSKQVDLYRIYRDTVAQFEPSAVPFDSTTDTFYVDISGVVGDTGTHYYYTVTAVVSGNETGFSRSVGEFDRGLINGE